MLGVHLLLQRTKLGKAMRAMADNEDLARVTGIPTERVIRLCGLSVAASQASVATCSCWKAARYHSISAGFCSCSSSPQSSSAASVDIRGEWPEASSSGWSTVWPGYGCHRD